MKNIILILITTTIVSLSSTISKAQSGAIEYTSIMKTLNYYLVGGTNNDFSMLEKAFHPNATMKFISAEGYKEVNAVQFFKKGIKPGPPQNRETKIVSIDITGRAAQAKLTIKYETFTFYDYMNLLKIDGEWKIANKIFCKSNN